MKYLTGFVAGVWVETAIYALWIHHLEILGLASLLIFWLMVVGVVTLGLFSFSHHE